MADKKKNVDEIQKEVNEIVSELPGGFASYEKDEETGITYPTKKTDEVIAKINAYVTTYYTPMDWKGVKTVYKCASCETFRDTKAEIIAHLVTHYPKEQRIELSERLLKE